MICKGAFIEWLLRKIVFIENNLIIKKNSVYSLIDAEQPESPSRATFGWRSYHDLGDIYKWLDQMLKQYPDELTNYNVGKSYEKRNIRAVKLSRKSVKQSF